MSEAKDKAVLEAELEAQVQANAELEAKIQEYEAARLLADANSKETDAALDNSAKSVGEQLKKQKKVKVKLHLSTEDRQQLEAAEAAGKTVVWPYETVNINGYTFQIQRGKEVQVPESVYEVLSQSNII